MRYLLPSDVLDVYTEVADDPDPLFDFHALEAAVLRPKEAAGRYEVYPDIHEKAAALFDELIRGAPFERKNLAVAVVCTALFYELNDWTLSIPENELSETAALVRKGEAGTTAQVATTFGRCATHHPPPLDDEEPGSATE